MTSKSFLPARAHSISNITRKIRMCELTLLDIGERRFELAVQLAEFNNLQRTIARRIHATAIPCCRPRTSRRLARATRVCGAGRSASAVI